MNAGSESEKAVLIYDGTCRLCVAAADWVGRSARAGALEFLPSQSAERAARFPQISEAACAEAMQLVLPDGRVLSGEQALPALFRRMRRWRCLAALFRVPGVNLAAPYIYRWIARHRHGWSEATVPNGSSYPPEDRGD